MENRRGMLKAALQVGSALLISSATARAASGGRYEVTKSDAEWRRILTPDQYYVLRGHGTEYSGSSPLDREKRKGIFHCAARAARKAALTRIGSKPSAACASGVITRTTMTNSARR